MSIEWPVKTAPLAPTPRELHSFADLVAEAIDETPVQSFLAAHPSFFTIILPLRTCFHCFDRPKLGAEYVPDFLLTWQNSAGRQWMLVELESPAVPPLTKAGVASQHLNTALGQIADWRSWLRENVAYARSQLGLRGIDADAYATVIVGRRLLLRPMHAHRYAALSTGKQQVMTYDRLGEQLGILR